MCCVQFVSTSLVSLKCCRSIKECVLFDIILSKFSNCFFFYLFISIFKNFRFNLILALSPLIFSDFRRNSGDFLFSSSFVSLFTRTLTLVDVIRIRPIYTTFAYFVRTEITPLRLPFIYLFFFIE